MDQPVLAKGEPVNQPVVEEVQVEYLQPLGQRRRSAAVVDGEQLLRLGY